MINAQPKAPEKGGLDTSRLLKLMSDINGQPDWRSLAVTVHPDGIDRKK